MFPLSEGLRLSILQSGFCFPCTAIHTATIPPPFRDGCRLTVAAIRRGFSAAVKYCCEHLKKHGIDAGWRVYISHAATQDKVDLAEKLVRAAVPGATIEIVPLSPAFITQGGPNCLAIQYIKE